VEHGADKEATPDVSRNTALIVAADQGHVAVVEYLLEQGCNIEHTNRYGRTALHEAARHGYLEVAQLLMRWGANLNARSNVGDLPIDLAIRYGHDAVADAIRAEEIRRRDHGLKRDRSTIEGTEEHEASRRPRVEEEKQKEEEVDLSDDDDDDDDDDEDEG